MAAIGPAFKKGLLNRAQVSNADIAPTLAQLVGVTSRRSESFRAA